jgi:predicted metal-dependent HD superfamily phosphohydrolase
MNLAVEYAKLCAQNDLNPEGFWSDLSLRLNEPHRAYHNDEHIVSVLRRIDYLIGLAAGQGHDVDETVVRFAAFYHDAVYVPGFAFNERLSADMAASHLTAMGLDLIQRYQVHNIILKTKKHEVDVFRTGAPWEAKVLIDADLYELGTDKYGLNSHKVRNEIEYYGKLTDETWRQGRCKFLESFLARDRIFLLDGQPDLEAQARANMQEELDELDG